MRPVDKIDQQGNNLLQRLLGAHVTVIREYDHAAQQEAIQAKIAEQEALGKKVYWPRQADTVDLDAIAYAESALEVVHRDGRSDAAVVQAALGVQTLAVRAAAERWPL